MKNINNIIFDLGGVFLNIDFSLTNKAFIDLGVLQFNEMFTQHFSNPLFELLETGKIVYYTKCGDRKKYFKPSSLAERIKNHLTIVKSEQNLIKKIREYEGLYGVNSICENDQKIVELYRDYINQFELLISDFITKIEKLETN